MKSQNTSDSIGVYAVMGDVIKPVELINYNNVKISRGFMSAKTKLEFNEKTSPTRFKGAAKFLLYFGQPSSYDMAKLYMFTPTYSVKDFGIGKFEVKKGKRLLTTAKVAVFGSINTGAEDSEDIAYDVLEVRPGVYELTITGAPGEYCIMHTFRGGAGYGGVFDFTIE